MAPGWERIHFEPCFSVDACEVAVTTPKGTIRATCHKRGLGIVVRPVLPPNVGAEVALPGVFTSTATKSSRWKIPLA